MAHLGSGKSTSTRCIFDVIIADQWPYYFGWSKSLSPSDWHKEISYVPQNIFILDDSLEANIAFGEEEEYYDLENKEMYQYLSIE